MAPKPGQGSAATGVEGIRLTTLQDLPLESFIAFEVPQPERDNEPMVVLVQCWKVTEAPHAPNRVSNSPMEQPIPPIAIPPIATTPSIRVSKPR